MSRNTKPNFNHVPERNVDNRRKRKLEAGINPKLGNRKLRGF
jgi:hypothetical protein